MAHPTALSILVESKENRPLFRLWARGSPSFLSSVSLDQARGRRATRRMAWISPDRPESAWLPGGPGTPGPGREASRPAPCGAPTRHLCLCAFDRGRTGPAPSGRRGCPSTARGRWLRPPSPAGAAPAPRQQDASGRRPRRVDRDGGNIVTLKVKSSIIFTIGVFLYGE